MSDPIFISHQHYIVASVEDKTTKAGDPYLLAELIHKQHGRVAAKVWSNALDRVTLKKNTVVSIVGEEQEYRGQKQLVVQEAVEVTDANLDDYLPDNQTPTMIFDIETVGKDFNELDHKSQAYLLHNLEKNTDEAEAKTKTGLYPLFGLVSFIAMFNPASQKGIILGLCEAELSPENPQFSFESFTEEKDLLIRFWQLAEKYQRFVTYNGHGFDFPFLALRSAINRVKVPIELKFNSDDFIDLMKKFGSYSRSYTLEMLTTALGVSNPKEKGVSGSMVSELYSQKKYQEIVDYVARDAISTYQVYQIWKTYLAGKIIV